MNKKLIAIAVAAGLAPMAAQAEPTLYGQLQVEVASYDDGKETKANDAKGTPASGRMKTDDNKRGRLGVKGSEDLGNGMSAIYNFEWQIETTQGDVKDGNRVGMVGLKGGFGTVMAGALKTPYKYYGGVKYDPFVTTFMEARSRGGMSGKYTDGSKDWGASSLKDAKLSGSPSGANGHHGFMTDAISYKNKFGALEIWANISLDEDGGSKGADGDMNLGAKFSGGNFEAFVAMAHDDQVKVSAGGTLGSITKGSVSLAEYDATKFGGMFKMGPHKIKAQIEMTELAYKSYYDGATATKETDTDVKEGDVMFLGYELAMGSNIIAVNYGATEIKDKSTGFADVKTTIDYLAVGAIHKFSKKTRAFAGYSTSEKKVGTGKAVEEDVISVGLRVDF